MFPTHVLEKEIQSTTPSLEDSKEFATLVTEEILFRRMIDTHKSLMTLLVAFHGLLVFFSSLSVLYGGYLVEKGFVCSHSREIQNAGYIIANLIILRFAFGAIFRTKAMISDMQFYQRAKTGFMIAALIGLSLLVLKFVVQIGCEAVSLSLYHSLVVFFHLLVECFVLTAYVRWFRKELRNFGSLIN